MIWDKPRGLAVSEKDIQDAIHEQQMYGSINDNINSYQLSVARGVTTFADLMYYVKSLYLKELNDHITLLQSGTYYQTYGDQLIMFVDIGTYGHHLFRWEYTITFPWNNGDLVKVFIPHYPDADIISNDVETEEEPVETYSIDDIIPDWIFEDIRHI